MEEILNGGSHDPTIPRVQRSFSEADGHAIRRERISPVATCPRNGADSQLSEGPPKKASLDCCRVRRRSAVDVIPPYSLLEMYPSLIRRRKQQAGLVVPSESKHLLILLRNSR